MLKQNVATEFWAPCDSVGSPIGGMEGGWYGSVHRRTNRKRLGYTFDQTHNLRIV